ncbi:MAG: PAS domain-containing sensor histidine kinase [Rickettsiaceae bacterium]
MIKGIWNDFNNKRLKSSILYIVNFVVIATLCANLFFLYKESLSEVPNWSSMIGFLLSSLVSILILCVLIISHRVSSNFTFIKRGKRRVSKLRKRIIIAFSIGAALPTIIVAVFSTYFFNFGIEAWFDKKITKVLDQSVSVGEAYIAEHILQLKDTAISVSEDLNAMYYDLIRNPDLFTRVINAQAELRSFDEALVFQKTSNTILAQTALSFSLAFTTIPAHLMERADNGEVVQIESAPSKIRILIKLKDFNDTYLLIGRLVDTKIIDHIDKTKGAAQEYNHLKSQIVKMQIKFSTVFILLSLILLTVAIIWGRSFAEKIVKPIRELVIAAERVKNGDFSVQVPLENLKKDEIKILSSAFNRMVNQIDHQQKELVIAQRALAWSDVARRVAHEIKNPLTPIQLSAERLLKKFKGEVSDSESFTKYANNILKHSDDIRKIVSEFVEFARLPSPSFSKCEIVSLLHDLVEARRLVSDTIAYNFTSNVNEHNIVCDIGQINRVMVNLILNSEEALADLSKKDKNITVRLYAENEKVTISVEDNGPGFNEGILETAKESYVTTKPDGSGLGLAIVEKIVFDHFGSLIISNNSFGGAKVELTIGTAALKDKLK